MNLDEPARFAEVDRADALGDVEGTPGQWQRARELTLHGVDPGGVEAVVITGMGGSGISGDVVAALAAERLAVPVVVHKGFGMPAFVGPRTLVFAVSSSGDTRETLDAADTAIGRGAQVAAVTGGGRLGALCEERGLPWVTVPQAAQPRHSLGYLVTPILAALGLDDDLDEAVAVQEAVAGDLGRHVPAAGNAAKRLALALAERVSTGVAPAIAGPQGLGSVAAYRLKCQLNENAKLRPSFGVLPETGHNEVAGWASRMAPILVCVRDPGGESPQLRKWVEALLALAAERFGAVEQVTARGSSAAARLLSLLLTGDLVSIYVALALDRDPTPIAEIDRLKAALSRADR